MRPLTETGFMKRYLKDLSNSNTSSVHKLIKEIPDNPRIVEPLAYFCIITDVPEKACKKDRMLYEMWRKMSAGKGETEISRIISAYKYASGRKDREDNLKALMHKKITVIMADKGITKYQVYSRLSLDPSNVNSYIKNCDCSRITVDTARQILNYVSDI